MKRFYNDIHICCICAACVLIELRQLMNELLCFQKCDAPFWRQYNSIAYGIMLANVCALFID